MRHGAFAVHDAHETLYLMLGTTAAFYPALD